MLNEKRLFRKLKRKNSPAFSLYVRRAFIVSIFFISTFLHVLYCLAQPETSTGKIFGRITDRVTNTPLIGASVNIVDTALGTMANIEGDYELEHVQPGIYNVRFSMIGYSTLIKTNVTVSPERSTELSVQLESQPVEMKTITVTGRESYFEKDPEAEVSGRTIDTQEIVNSAGGLMDIQRVVQVLATQTSYHV